MFPSGLVVPFPVADGRFPIGDAVGTGIVSPDWIEEPRVEHLRLDQVRKVRK